MAHDVFISYANKDKTTADALVATLEQHQIRCWIAPRDVLPGQDYAEMLIEAIGDAEVMVLVFSSNSNNSSHVLREVERAASKNIAILPLRIEDVPPSSSMEFFISKTHQLGDGQVCGASTCTPVDVSGLSSGVAEVAVGGDHAVEHTCALTEAGGVKCWGDNRSGQIGDGSSSFSGRTTPSNVLGLTSRYRRRKQT